MPPTKPSKPLHPKEQKRHGCSERACQSRLKSSFDRSCILVCIFFVLVCVIVIEQKGMASPVAPFPVVCFVCWGCVGVGVAPCGYVDM